MVGNDHGIQPTLGRMDAMNGLFLKGDGTGHFTALSLAESGFYVPGNAKALVSLFVGNRRSVIISQNNDVLLAFRYGDEVRAFVPESDDFKITFIGNGEKVIDSRFLYYGNGFLSQSSRKTAIPEGTEKMVVAKFDGKERAIDWEGK